MWLIIIFPYSSKFVRNLFYIFFIKDWLPDQSTPKNTTHKWFKILLKQEIYILIYIMAI